MKNMGIRDVMAYLITTSQHLNEKSCLKLVKELLPNLDEKEQIKISKIIEKI